MLGIIAEKPQESIGVGEGGQEAAGWGEAKLSYPRFGATCSVAARTAARACAGEQLRLGSVQGNRVWGWDGQSDWQAANGMGFYGAGMGFSHGQDARSTANRLP